MENFEFKSAVCTTKEQSERLLKLGLKKESADMVHYKSSSMKEWGVLATPFTKECEACKSYYPAWSLHRIVEIMFKGDIKGFVGYNIHANNVGIMYEYAISNIEALIKMGSFNKDYLEKKL